MHLPEKRLPNSAQYVLTETPASTGERAPMRMPWRSAAPAAPLQHAYFFTISPDGSRLWRVPTVPSDFGAHLDFGPDGRLLLCQGKAAFLIEV